MKRALKWGGLAALVLLGSCATALGAVWVMAEPAFDVRATVTDDPSLPMVDVDGTSFHAEAFGDPDAPVVVVLHGGPGGDYRNTLSLRALSDTHRVVFYDQRGAGLSARVDRSTVSLERHYRDLDAIIDHFAGQRQVDLVGHSWGAMLAVGYIGERPERVRRAVLAEPGYLTPEAGVAFMDAADQLMPEMTIGNLWIFFSSWLESLKVEGPDEDAGGDYLVQRLTSRPGAEGHPIAGYFCDDQPSSGDLVQWRFGSSAADALLATAVDDEGRMNVDFTTGLDAFEGSILLLASECNDIMGEAHQRRYHLPELPTAEFMVVPGVGHTMFGEEHRESVAVVRGFLARPSATPPPNPESERTPRDPVRVGQAPSSETTGGSANVGEAGDDGLAMARGLVAAWRAGDEAALAALGLPDGFWVWFDDGTFPMPSLHVTSAGCAEPGAEPVPCASHPRAIRVDVGLRALEAALANVHYDEPVPRYPEAAHPTRSPWATSNAEPRRFTSYVTYIEGDPQLSPVEETIRMADSEVFGLSGSDEVLLVMGRHEGALRILHILVMQSEAG